MSPRRSNLDRLIENVELLESVAEAAQDAQASLVDPEQRAWLAGYRQAMQDVHDAHQLHAAAFPERTTS